MFCVMWLVTASSSAEPHAASDTQSVFCFALGRRRPVVRRLILCSRREGVLAGRKNCHTCTEQYDHRVCARPQFHLAGAR